MTGVQTCALPISGGLDDTIVDAPPAQATGFKFDAYNGNALREAVGRACRLWTDREAWTAMMVRGMQKDYSWTASAGEYSRLYSALLDTAAVNPKGPRKTLIS